MSEVPVMACVFSALFGAMLILSIVATVQEDAYSATLCWILSATLLFQTVQVSLGAI